MSKYIYLIIISLAVHTSCAYAENRDSVASSCSDWSKVRQEQSEATTLYWFNGFISAYNKYKYTGKHPKGVLKNNSQENISIWLDEYCLLYKGETLQSAIESLIEEKKPMVKACSVKKQSGRPCIPYDGKIATKDPRNPAIKSKWKFWE
jgi:hypothetical protein